MFAAKSSIRPSVFWILGLSLNLWAQSNWTVRRTGTTSLATVTWTGTQFVAAGFDSILSSPDGITWTSRPAPVCCLADVIWTGSQLVAVGGVIQSWEPPGALPKQGSGTQLAAARGATAVGDTNSTTSFGYAVTSPDGITWTQRNPGASLSLSSVAWAGSRLVAVGAEGRAYVSPDGVTWTSHQAAGEMLLSIVWTGHQLVALGASGVAVSDSIGSSWTFRTIASALSSVTSGKGIQVAVGAAGILSSSDGITWTPRHSGTGEGLSEVIWTGNEFVVVGNGGGGGIVLTSPDGIAWTARNPGPSVGLYAVAVSNTQLVALSTNRSILTSPLEPVAILASGAHRNFSIRLTSSHLFAVVPNTLGAHPRAVLYGSSGRKVAEVEVNPDASEVTIPVDNLERGVYVLVMSGKSASFRHRFSLTR